MFSKWYWSQSLINKKRVIGVDPFENIIPNVELFKGILGTVDGKTKMSFNNFKSNIFSNDGSMVDVDMLSWKSFCKMYNIDKISILKINIEGAEFSLLNSLDKDDYDKIDQIAISFHDWLNPNWSELTKTSLYLLKNMNYEIIKIHDECNWYLCLKKHN